MRAVAHADRCADPHKVDEGEACRLLAPDGREVEDEAADHLDDDDKDNEGVEPEHRQALGVAPKIGEAGHAGQSVRTTDRRSRRKGVF